MTIERPNGVDRGEPAARPVSAHPWPTVWIVAAIAFLCYANSPRNGFVYDSIQIVERNPLVHAPGCWLDVWAVDHWFQEEGRTADRDLLYRPVALLSYRVVHCLAGPDPFPQHLVNVLMHAVISVLVFFAASRLGFSVRTSTAAALLFAVLPIHTEVVNDIVGRTDLLATTGVLLALAAHHRYATATAANRQRLWLSLAALAAFAAMGAKENGISVLLLIPLFDAFEHRRRPQHDGTGPWLSARTLVRLSYLIVPTIAYLTLRYVALDGQLFQEPAATKTINQLVDASPWQHVLGVLQAWGMYWQKTLWPAVLSPDYSIHAVRLARSMTNTDVLFGAAVAVGLLLAAVVAWRRGVRGVAWCAIAVVLTFAPASNAVVLTQAFFAERIWYLPSVWVVMLLGGVLSSIRNRSAWLVALTVIVAAMFGRCWIRNPEWKSNATLAAAAHRDHPDAIASLVMYGNMLATTGELDCGLAMLQRAVEIDPGFTVAHRALGKAYQAAGDLERSLVHWRIAEMQFPGHPEVDAALHIVGNLLAGRREGELAAAREAADARPDDLDAELNYLRMLIDLGRNEEALARMDSADKRFSAHVAWQRQYAVALLYAGRRDAAIVRYQRCLELAPSAPGTMVELAALLLERRDAGDQEEAERLVRRALELAPDDAGARVLHAEMLAMRGDIEEALRVYAKVIESLPADSPQRTAWEARARTLAGN